MTASNQNLTSSHAYASGIDATLTNELKPQQIILSRYEQGEGSPLAEEGATVVVFEDGTAYDFVELENGVYPSSTSFEIQQHWSYYLEITTRNGKRYRSSTETLPATAELKSLYAEREVNDDGIEGVGMYVDGESTSTEAMFYRFDFEETFVVAPPYFTNLKTKILPLLWNIQSRLIGINFKRLIAETFSKSRYDLGVYFSTLISKYLP